MMFEEPTAVLEITRSPKAPEVAIAGNSTPSRRFQSRLRQNGHASDSSSLTDLDDSEAETERLGDSPYKNPTKIVHQPPQSSNLSLTSTAFTMKKHTSTEPDSPTKELQENDADSHMASIPNSPTPAKKRKLNTGRGRSISPLHHDENDTVRSKSLSPTARNLKDEGDITLGIKRSHTEPVAGATISEASTTPTVRQALSPAPTGTENDDQMDIDSVHGQPQGSEKSDEPENDADELDVKRPKIAPDGDDADADEEANLDDEEGTRKAAMEQLAEIEKDFAKLRDKIYEERVQEVENEIRMVDEGTHPQFLAMLESVNKRRDDNILLHNAKFNYAVQSLDTSTKATRAQIHSQFYQGIRNLREKYLSMVSANWYQIQRERRVSDTLVPDYTFRLAEDKNQRVLERKKYEKEVEILTKVQTTMGFPAAPEIKSLTAAELASDLQEMGIPSSRSHEPRLLERTDERDLQLYPYPTAWQSRPASPAPLVHHRHHHHHTHPQPHHHHHSHVPHVEPASQGPRRSQILQKINTAQQPTPLTSSLYPTSNRQPDLDRRENDMGQVSASMLEAVESGRYGQRLSKTSKSAFPVARDEPNGTYGHQMGISSRQISYA